MQVKTADTYRNDRAWPLLAAVAVLLGASAFAKVAAFYVEQGRMHGVAGVAPARCDPNDLKSCLTQARKTAETIKQKNLFFKEPSKKNPVQQVDGILGNEAFIAGKWYKAGVKVGDAKIVEIRPTFVTVEWEGKTTNLAPIGAATAESSSPPAARKEPKKETPPEAKQDEGKPEAAKVETTTGVEEDDPLGWLGVKLSPRMRTLLLEKWNAASDEEKARAKEDWDKMSDDDKQRMVDQMEQHM
jgi:hypothetical protein